MTIMTKKYITFVLISSLVILGCTDRLVSSNKVYSMQDIASAGFKLKKDFDTEFPEATDSKCGFFKGREVAILRYPTVDLANTSGETAGLEQTEKIEVIEKNYAFGPKVERTMCRGDRAATSGQVASGLKLNVRNSLGFEDVLIINKSKLFEKEVYLNPYDRSGLQNCPRREPIYLAFITYGNLIILGEPMPGDDSEAIIKFLEESTLKLP